MISSTPMPAITPRSILEVFESPFVSGCSSCAVSVCDPVSCTAVSSVVSCTVCGASVGVGVGSAAVTYPTYCPL